MHETSWFCLDSDSACATTGMHANSECKHLLHKVPKPLFIVTFPDDDPTVSNTLSSFEMIQWHTVNNHTQLHTLARAMCPNMRSTVITKNQRRISIFCSLQMWSQNFPLKINVPPRGITVRAYLMGILDHLLSSGLVHTLQFDVKLHPNGHFALVVLLQGAMAVDWGALHGRLVTFGS